MNDEKNQTIFNQNNQEINFIFKNRYAKYSKNSKSQNNLNKSDLINNASNHPI